MPFAPIDNAARMSFMLASGPRQQRSSCICLRPLAMRTANEMRAGRWTTDDICPLSASSRPLVPPEVPSRPVMSRGPEACPLAFAEHSVGLVGATVRVEASRSRHDVRVITTTAAPRRRTCHWPDVTLGGSLQRDPAEARYARQNGQLQQRASSTPRAPASCEHCAARSSSPCTTSRAPAVCISRRARRHHQCGPMTRDLAAQRLGRGHDVNGRKQEIVCSPTSSSRSTRVPRTRTLCVCPIRRVRPILAECIPAGRLVWGAAEQQS